MNRVAIIITIFLMIFHAQIVFADAEFGEYRYSQYLGIQQQLQNQRANALRRQRMYQKSPTRNIRYPSMGNSYPNIQRSYGYRRLTPQQRYSARYYNSL